MSDVATAIARKAIVDAVCDRIIAGESVAAVFRTPSAEFPSYSTFYRWLAADAELAALVNATEIAACNALADRIIDVARETRLGEIVTDSEKDGRSVKTVDMVERSKLEVHALQWTLARRLPKKYGDRTILSGDGDNPIAIADLTEAKADLLRRFAAEAVTGATGDVDREPDR